MKYQNIQAQIQQRYNEFPMKFAFNQAQLDRGLAELNITAKEAVSIGNGGFIRKSDKEAFLTMVNECAKLREECMADDEYVETMFYYELGNHEYCVTYDLEDTLDACDLTADEVNNDPRLKKLLFKALEQYEKDTEDWW